MSWCSIKMGISGWMAQSENMPEGQRLWLNRKEWSVSLCGFVRYRKGEVI